MSFIIGNKCVGVCDTSCVSVCPVACINGPIEIDGEGWEVADMTEEQLKDAQLYINPEECIDCGACIPECPVDAIYRDEDEAIEKDDLKSVHKNYEFYNQKFSS